MLIQWVNELKSLGKSKGNKKAFHQDRCQISHTQSVNLEHRDFLILIFYKIDCFLSCVGTRYQIDMCQVGTSQIGTRQICARQVLVRQVLGKQVLGRQVLCRQLLGRQVLGKQVLGRYQLYKCQVDRCYVDLCQVDRCYVDLCQVDRNQVGMQIGTRQIGRQVDSLLCMIFLSCQLRD